MGLSKKFDLEDRLVDFAVMIISTSAHIPVRLNADHLSRQLFRSGTSAALNYAEARAAESKRDFVHKMKISLKELRETSVCLKIINRAELHRNLPSLRPVMLECDELIAIFVKSIETAKKNAHQSKSQSQSPT
jgi:four helix bundle protein